MEEMENLAKVITNYGILVIIAIIFLWQYIEELKEKKTDREKQEENMEALREALNNNTEVLHLAQGYHKKLDDDLEANFNNLNISNDDVKKLLGIMQEDITSIAKKVESQEALNGEELEKLDEIFLLIKELHPERR